MLGDIIVGTTFVVGDLGDPGQLQYLFVGNSSLNKVALLLLGMSHEIEADHLLCQILSLVRQIFACLKQTVCLLHAANVEKETAQHLKEVNGWLRIF